MTIQAGASSLLLLLIRLKISGNRFRAENITFSNSAGPVGQAVALHVECRQCHVCKLPLPG